MIVFSFRRWLLVPCFFLMGVPAFGQTKPALFYSLPADGAWVEFEMTRPGGETANETARLRLSSVGGEVVNGMPHRWIEIRREAASAGKPSVALVKILIAESAFGDGALKKDSVAKAFEQRGSGTAIRRLSPQQYEDVITFGFPGEEARFTPVSEKEEVSVPLGKFTCKQMKGTVAKGASLEMNVWLTRDIPFGWAKAEVGIPNTPKVVVVAVKTGKDAKSELDETKAK